jgi:hypothetical protein
MIDFLQWIAGVGGIGAVFAVLLFFVYRQTNKQMREDRKFAEDRLTTVISDYNKACKEQADAARENAVVLRELIIWLRAKNGEYHKS